MNDSLKEKLLGILSKADDKKLDDAIDKAMQLMKNVNPESINGFLGDKGSKGSTPNGISPELLQLIDKLPDSKKMELWDKFNTPEVQEALKNDKEKAIEMLKKTILN